jgi:hypothetical protein
MIRRPWGWLRLAWAVPPCVATTAVTIARPRPTAHTELTRNARGYLTGAAGTDTSSQQFLAAVKTYN